MSVQLGTNFTQNAQCNRLVELNCDCMSWFGKLYLPAIAMETNLKKWLETLIVGYLYGTRIDKCRIYREASNYNNIYMMTIKWWEYNYFYSKWYQNI